MKKEVNQNESRLYINGTILEPPLYQVVVHNDDYTPMEFVMEILQKFFFMDRRKAADVTMEAHLTGRGLCGLFSKDFAESKTFQVVEYAKLNQHPLNLSFEPVSSV